MAAHFEYAFPLYGCRNSFRFCENGFRSAKTPTSWRFQIEYGLIR
jgi:hypothetical protein